LAQTSVELVFFEPLHNRCHRMEATALKGKRKRVADKEINLRITTDTEDVVRRPLQLKRAIESAHSLPADALLEHFVKDVRAGRLVSKPCPSRPLGDASLLRVAQWNVNNFSGCYDGNVPDPWQIVELALSLEADVLVLNEFYAWDDQTAVKNTFLAEGYELAFSDTDFPTLLAKRCPSIGKARSLVFSHSKDIMAKAASGPSTCRLHRAATSCTLRLASGEAMVIYATHLNHIDGGGARREEAKAVLDDIRGRGAEAPHVLVVADFNQPRKCDYSPDEWMALARSAAEREEPEDDGVATLFEGDGFACSLDLSHLADRNWPVGALPPPTHWTGTVIDYSFARGLHLQGTYVVPTLLSDHFPVVSDWSVSGN